MAAPAPVELRPPFITCGTHIYTYNKMDKQYIYNHITFDDLERLERSPPGYGGTIGFIPYYRKDDNIIFLLTKNKWKNKKSGTSGTVIGCIGGGIDRKKTPYEGFVKELREEVPEYIDVIQESLRNNHSTEIISIEKIPVKLSAPVFYAIIIFHEIPEGHALEMYDTIKGNVNHEITHIELASAKPSQYKTLHNILHNNDLSSGLSEYTFFVDILSNINKKQIGSLPPHMQHDRLLHKKSNSAAKAKSPPRSSKSSKHGGSYKRRTRKNKI